MVSDPLCAALPIEYIIGFLVLRGNFAAGNSRTWVVLCPRKVLAGYVSGVHFNFLTLLQRTHTVCALRAVVCMFLDPLLIIIMYMFLYVKKLKQRQRAVIAQLS